MIKITREEVLKLARACQLDIHENEIQSIIDQLEQMLSYAVRVKEIAADAQEPSVRNINVFREDVVVSTNPEIILDKAPEREGNYFVVPIILENV
ncbi:MAG: Asp-tRNA(Asn)/Glu-tRNA(Gln) amidotransferase subunit GatC [bacterium]|nr:Asp-tRNA(Asn)/Glu-tRNA(Gln) amidotransferase subunit GatC [bacterium]